MGRDLQAGGQACEQELILLPTGRAAKRKAKLAIREMIPYIGAVVQAMVPTHSWSYKQLLDLYDSGEMEYEEILEEEVLEDLDDSYGDQIGEKTLGDDQDVREEQSGNQARQLHAPIRFDELLDNPSIQIYPQHHTQIDLQSVQNLSTVFDDLYSKPSRPSEMDGRERAQHQTRRPRPSYVRYFQDVDGYTGEEEEPR